MESRALYRPRVVDDELDDRLNALGAVLVEGPKACGKTETARRVAASEVRLDVDADARQAMAIDPSLLLQGATPRLIDEWQAEPEIWNHVRRAVDDRREPGQFVLTGSAAPADVATRHTGAGRFSRLRMRPMSLFEAGRSNGAIGLSSLLEGDLAACPEPGLKVGDLAEEIARGGWPATLDRDLGMAVRATRDYLDQIAQVDVSTLDGRRRDPQRLGLLLRSLARHTATHANTRTLAKDLGGAEGKIKDETAAEYLDTLRRLFIVEDQPSWAPHLRSRYTLRKAPKRHFVDPSLAVAALRSSPQDLLNDLNFLGLLFESLVVRDLRIYAQSSDAEVLQYRDSNGHEVDAIVRGADGRWAAFEVKLGTGRLVEEAAASLQRFIKQIDLEKCGPPALLGVIVGTGYGYTRPDGIGVIPIGALGP